VITTQAKIRELFWQDNPQFTRRPGWKQNQYPVNIRLTFIDFVDMKHRNGEISEALAGRATL
jgi:hypothetical protein